MDNITIRFECEKCKTQQERELTLGRMMAPTPPPTLEEAERERESQRSVLKMQIGSMQHLMELEERMHREGTWLLGEKEYWKSRQENLDDLAEFRRKLAELER